MSNSNWDKVCIKDVCESIIDCVNKTAPSVDYETPFKMIRTTNVRDGWINLDVVKHVTEDVYQKWIRRGKPQKGDIILTREAPLGEVGMLRTSEDVFLGQRTMQYRVNPKKLDNRFLLYSFMSHDLQGQIRAFGSGATVEHMRVPDAEKLMLTLPDIKTQKKIGVTLASYDDLIENNLKRIKILEEMAQMIYREWFVNFRFPNHESVKMVDSHLGNIPEGWEVRKATDSIDFNPRIKVEKDSIKPHVDMKGLSEFSMIVEQTGETLGNSGSKFQRGDTLFARITPCLENGKTGYVRFLNEGQVAIGSTEFIVMRSKELTPEYVYLLSRTNDFRGNAIASMAGASGRQRVSNECFSKFIFAKPPQRMLDSFTDAVRPMFELIHELSLKNTNLRKIRDLLLPKLISGELDVENLDIKVPEEVS